MIIWDIMETRSGFDILKSGKAFANDLISDDEAKRKIKKSRYYNSAQTVRFHSIDGYRKTITL